MTGAHNVSMIAQLTSNTTSQIEAKRVWLLFASADHEIWVTRNKPYLFFREKPQVGKIRSVHLVVALAAKTVDTIRMFSLHRDCYGINGPPQIIRPVRASRGERTAQRIGAKSSSTT